MAQVPWHSRTLQPSPHRGPQRTLCRRKAGLLPLARSLARNPFRTGPSVSLEWEPRGSSSPCLASGRSGSNKRTQNLADPLRVHLEPVPSNHHQVPFGLTGVQSENKQLLNRCCYCDESFRVPACGFPPAPHCRCRGQGSQSTWSSPSLGPHLPLAHYQPLAQLQGTAVCPQQQGGRDVDLMGQGQLYRWAGAMAGVGPHGLSQVPCTPREATGAGPGGTGQTLPSCCRSTVSRQMPQLCRADRR